MLVARLSADRRLAPALAISDQAIYALTNLGLQIIVARSISAEEFGAYSVASTFFFIAALLHQTCIIEPMFVFTARRYGSESTAYTARLRRGWSVIFGAAMLLVGLALGCVAWLLGSLPLAESFWGFALATPALLYLLLLRRMAFLLARIDIAVGGGLIYGLVLFGTAGAVRWSGHMTAFTGVCLSGIAAAIAAAAVLALIPRPAPGGPPPADMALQHMRYGRWAMGSEGVNWLIVNGPILVLPLWFGLSASGHFRVLNLLFMPLQQVVSALTSILLRRYASGQQEADSMQTVLKYVLMLLAGATVYSILAVQFGPGLAPWMVGTSYVVEPRWLLLGATSTTCFVSAQGFMVALRAREQSHQVLLVHVLVLAVVAGLLPEVAAFGISGVLFAQTVAWALALVMAGLLVARGTRPLAPAHPPGPADAIPPA